MWIEGQGFFQGLFRLIESFLLGLNPAEGLKKFGVFAHPLQSVFDDLGRFVWLVLCEEGPRQANVVLGFPGMCLNAGTLECFARPPIVDP